MIYPASGLLAPGTPINWQRSDQGRDLVIPWRGVWQAAGDWLCTKVGADRPFPNGFGPTYPRIRFFSGPYKGHEFYFGHCSSLVRTGQRGKFGDPLARADQGHNFEGTNGGWTEFGEVQSDGSLGPFDSNGHWFDKLLRENLVIGGGIPKVSSYFADVSSNNGAINIPAYASSGALAISIKATEGTNYKNPYYSSENGGAQNQARDAHRYSLAVFHYHFCRPEHGDPKGQAEFFWHSVQPHFQPKHGDVVVWDLETGDPGQANQWLQEADAHLRKIAPVNPVCYTYLSFFNSGRITIPSRKIWMAAYGSQRPGSWNWKLPFGQTLWAWQYTDGGGYGPGPQRFAGIPGTSDGSLLNPPLARTLARNHH